MSKTDKGLADQAVKSSTPPLHTGSGDDSLNGTRTESEFLKGKPGENDLPHSQEEQQVFEGIPDTPNGRKDQNNVHGNPIAKDRHTIADTLPAADFEYTDDAVKPD